MIEIVSGAFATPEIIISLVCVVLLLMCSGFISGSETAIFSLGPADIDKVKEKLKERPLGASAVLDLINDREYTLATILMLNNMVNILITLLTSHIIVKTLNFQSEIWEFLFISVFVTFLLLLFGEVLPKVIASHYSIGFAIKGAPVLRVLRKISKPFAFLLVSSGSKVSSLSNSTHDNISLDELSEAIDITQTRNDQEKQLLSGVVNFADTEVESIMCPRVDIVALEASVGFDEVRRVIIESGFSRIPVYKSTLDEVREADILMHVVDISHPNFEEHIKVVEETLRDIKAIDKPIFVVFNKIDAYRYEEYDEFSLEPKKQINYTLEEFKNSWIAKENTPCIFISAREKIGIEKLRGDLYKMVAEIHAGRYPFDNFLW